MSEKDFPYERLKSWFLYHRRSLPWREDSTPYRVWISEVMLQQTQVAVVIPYFERWIEAFPTIEALAAAPIEQILKMWEGLGYYSRARNLHAGAKFIVEHYGGELPDDPEKLTAIKGIGPYTQGAILNFAFRKKAPAVDGNVARVLARFYLREGAQPVLPDEEPWLISEGLIELGALVCKRDPKCESCPLMESCLAFRHGEQKTFPPPKKRPKTTKLSRLVGVIRYNGKILLKRGESGKVMADLYEFPYIEHRKDRPIQALFEEALDLKLVYLGPLPREEHSYTRYHVELIPHLFKAERNHPNHLWVDERELKHLPFSSGHKRIYENFTH